MGAVPPNGADGFKLREVINSAKYHPRFCCRGQAVPGKLEVMTHPRNLAYFEVFGAAGVSARNEGRFGAKTVTAGYFVTISSISLFKRGRRA
ncbi:MAG: hypothetical protein HZA03_06070 [Nitrospinae bacterium]|nr:hypothetical protein [Nitrospinota bacterium]